MNERSGVRIVFLVLVAFAAFEIYAMVHLFRDPPHRHPPTIHVPAPTDSATAAAVEIFTRLYGLTRSFEYGGVILKAEGGLYMASDPETQHNGIAVNFDEDGDGYPGYQVVADYHNHPCIYGAYTAKFSPTDIHNMRENKLPGYLLDMCTGDIHYWAPGDALDPPEFGVDAVLASGKIVGHIKVDGVELH